MSQSSTNLQSTTNPPPLLSTVNIGDSCLERTRRASVDALRGLVGDGLITLVGNHHDDRREALLLRSVVHDVLEGIESRMPWYSFSD